MATIQYPKFQRLSCFIPDSSLTTRGVVAGADVPCHSYASSPKGNKKRRLWSGVSGGVPNFGGSATA
jgi:hypothetical protein